VNSVELFSQIRQAFSAPTYRQQEAYARFLHTLAAASIIGEATLLFADGTVSVTTIGRIVGLTISGVICFVGGALLARGA